LWRLRKCEDGTIKGAANAQQVMLVTDHKFPFTAAPHIDQLPNDLCAGRHAPKLTDDCTWGDGIVLENRSVELAEIAEFLLLERLPIGMPAAVIITRGAMAGPDVVASRGVTAVEDCSGATNSGKSIGLGKPAALVVWLMLDPLDIDSKQTTFVMDGAGAPPSIFDRLYKIMPPPATSVRAAAGTVASLL
jgi:hypothetical protein